MSQGNDDGPSFGFLDGVIDIVETLGGKTDAARFEITNGREALCQFCQARTTLRLSSASKVGEALSPLCIDCQNGIAQAIRSHHNV